ncbi:hypothetical protein B0H21DRAFT_3422 [Amylocystis lapponica]|nr:hypothetical protein B0H21DRAFT_3422 [Amylocystis lapponica]
MIWARGHTRVALPASISIPASFARRCGQPAQLAWSDGSRTPTRRCVHTYTSTTLIHVCGLRVSCFPAICASSDGVAKSDSCILLNGESHSPPAVVLVLVFALQNICVYLAHSHHHCAGKPLPGAPICFSEGETRATASFPRPFIQCRTLWLIPLYSMQEDGIEY